MSGSIVFLSAVAEELGDLPGLAVGIGPLRAGIGAARLLGTGCAACVLVGTAGAYPGGPPIGAVVASGRLGLSCGVAEAGLGYVPAAPAPLSSDPVLAARLDLPVHDVLTVEAITTDPGLVAARATSWRVEHMEAYAVALAAAGAGVSFVAVLGISNEVGPDAHVQWKANRRRVEAEAREAARVLLR